MLPAGATMDPIGLKYFKLFPKPNLGNDIYMTAPVGSIFAHIADLRIDHNITSRDLLFARVDYNKSHDYIPSAFPDVHMDGMDIKPGGQSYTMAGGMWVTAINSTLNYTHIFSPRLEANFLAGYTFNNIHGSDLNPNTPINQNWGQPGVNLPSGSLPAGVPPEPNGLGMIQFATINSSLGNSGYFRPQQQTNNTFTYKGSVHWTHGNSNLVAGASLIRRQWTNWGSQGSLGNWLVMGPAELLQGKFISVQREVDMIWPQYRTWEPSFFIEESYKLRSNLTINAGLRYDIFTQPTAVKNQLANINLSTGKIMVAGRDGVSSTANVRNDYSSIGPRVGFEWAVNPSTTIHGGYGIVYFPPYEGTQFKVAPFAYTFGTCNPATCVDGQGKHYSTLSDGLPTVTRPSIDPASGLVMGGGRAENLKDLAMQQYNIGFDRKVGAKDMVRVSYVGSLGHHLSRQFPDANGPLPTADPNPQVHRPLYNVAPNLTTVQYTDTEGSSNYNAMQADYSHAIGHGLSGNFTYTLAHALDNAREWNRDSSGFGSVMALSSTRDYGNSNFDVRQHIVGTLHYALPLGNGTSGLRSTIEKNWQFNVMNVWGTGLPFTVLNAVNISQTNPGSNATDRPNLVPGVSPNPVHQGVHNFFNTAAFAAQPKGTLGDERRNQYQGPHSRHVDVSLFKTFNLANEKSLQFRTECFNLTNTANFAAPSATMPSHTFGQLTQMTVGYTPREIQFALRLQF
ncbi:MAG TPA: TonB-dependent receptor [Acidisarcina sp.]|nr:TonB-dependent receptor [Acidisarcina sp.]